MLAGGLARERGGEEAERGAEPLAAGLHEMRGDLVEEGVALDDHLSEADLEPVEIFVGHGKREAVGGVH
jgi:hypothetical protein